MANVLDEEKREQILALGRLGWSLRRIERELNVRRETAGAYLHAAGIVVRRAGGRVSRWPPVPDAALETAKPATTQQVITDSGDSKPATTDGVITDSALRQPGRAPSASACEPYRDLIEQGLRVGRNAMAIYQDLVTDHGFAARYNSVRLFAIKLRGVQVPEPSRVSGRQADSPASHPSHREGCDRQPLRLALSFARTTNASVPWPHRSRTS